MARLGTVGWESNDRLDTRNAAIECKPAGTSPLIATFDTGLVRSGDYSGRVRSNNSTSGYFQFDHISAMVASRTYYMRTYIYVDDLPLTANPRVLDWGQMELRFTNAGAGGVWRLYNNGTQVGADGPAVVLDRWQRLEVKQVLNGSSQITDVEIRLDGVTILSASGLTMTNSPTIFLGALDTWSAVATTVTVYFDDWAVNDDQGADQNTWPGPGKVVWLRPVSDVARGNWVGGAGGTTNLFAALDNEPPVGVAEASATNTSQTKVAGTGNNEDLDVTLETYASKGIAEADVVKVVQVFAYGGEGAVTTGTKTGSIGLLNDPVVSAAITSYGSSAVGTHPSQWLTYSATSYSQPGAKANAPVARLRANGAAAPTVFVHAEEIAAVVDYAPASLPPQVISYLS